MSFAQQLKGMKKKKKKKAKGIEKEPSQSLESLQQRAKSALHAFTENPSKKAKFTRRPNNQKPWHLPSSVCVGAGFFDMPCSHGVAFSSSSLVQLLLLFCCSFFLNILMIFYYTEEYEMMMDCCNKNGFLQLLLSQTLPRRASPITRQIFFS